MNLRPVQHTRKKRVGTSFSIETDAEHSIHIHDGKSCDYRTCDETEHEQK
jgi:hypothetical protein